MTNEKFAHMLWTSATGKICLFEEWQGTYEFHVGGVLVSTFTDYSSIRAELRNDGRAEHTELLARLKG